MISLPELAATIAGIMKNEPDIAVGNVIGSNMFNMLVVISVPVLIQPTEFESIVIWRDFIVMIGFTLIMGWMIYFNRSEIRERFCLRIQEYANKRSQIFHRYDLIIRLQHLSRF